ncbi:MAG TPA: LLM class flavin-dependent oxidoreductase [Candidatus Binatia bacterium]|jgi:alkanesulfonate monooxygenase SsuD/methylene tetrahydromethanopterin reductase-like flavin-dependent oxidoreductase (luciferase family)|nr:LLM class flavin-dependent oxidoreductase [Candidatus Binatia bacterium]
MERIAVAFSPLRDASPRDILAWSRRAEELGYEAVFIPESFNDSLAYAEAVAFATRRLRVGTAITNVYLRHPTLLAQQAAAVQEFSGGRLVLGIGVGHAAVNAPLGIDMGDPLAKIRDVVATLRAAWTKGPHQPRPAIPPKLLAAALAPKMIELAGEHADGAIFNLFPLARYPHAMNALRRGAERGGRTVETLEVCHFTTCYLGDDRAAALHEAKRMLARYANLPFYGNMLAASGFRDEVSAIRAAWRRKDVAAAEAAVSDGMADEVTLVGDPAHCRERLRAYRMAGATLAIVFPNPVGEARAAAVERALEAFAPRATL